MLNCRISFDRLVDFEEHLLSPSESDRIARHIAAGCARCTSALATLRMVMPQMGHALAIDLPSLSTDMINRALAVYDRFGAAVAPASTVPNWIGRVVFDTRKQMAFARDFSTGGGSSMVMFEAGPYHVDLWSERMSSNSWYMIGQASSESRKSDIKPDRVTLASASGERLLSLFEGEEFHLRSVAPGSYTLSLEMADGTIRLEDVTVGE